ncbi:Trp biosynthesis-associated membrane protein [Granulicoccus phenolivorans]|uniref:Trp biosynthesis-associated membrane protein n=1 Tax=Granulicoccus phenolivorans TaxID=266854 RepID=UPI0004233FA3|nr:Trp biosynthesis-associated membrane protein [Granulicoccus phenolivorans]
MTETRTRTLVRIGLPITAGAALLCAFQPWVQAGVRADGSGAGTSGQTGAQVLAGALLAGWLLSLTLRTLGQRILGVAMTLVALGGVALGLVNPGATGSTATGWHLGFAVAAALAAALCVVQVVRAGHWPVPVDRYARTQAASAEVTAEDVPQAIWKALDAGFDPTENGESSGSPEPDGRE